MEGPPERIPLYIPSKESVHVPLLPVVATQLDASGLTHNGSVQLSGLHPAFIHCCWIICGLLSSSTNVGQAAWQPDSAAGTGLAQAEAALGPASHAFAVAMALS